MTTVEDSVKARSRAVLTEAQAIEIYQYKKAGHSVGLDPHLSGRTLAIARKYNVSPKTIRDIWNRRSWINETQHLWDKGDQPMVRNKKKKIISRRPNLSSNHGYKSLTKSHIHAPVQLGSLQKQNNEQTARSALEMAITNEEIFSSPDVDSTNSLIHSTKDLKLEDSEAMDIQLCLQSPSKVRWDNNIRQDTYPQSTNTTRGRVTKCVPARTSGLRFKETGRVPSEITKRCSSWTADALDAADFDVAEIFQDSVFDLNNAPDGSPALKTQLPFHDPFHFDWPYW